MTERQSCDSRDDKSTAPQRDGIVMGTNGNDLIDTSYTGDPDGDRVDHADAILAGAAPEDDVVLAGKGDDTVRSGLGDDLVLGGIGDDVLEGGAGNDTLDGEMGDDTLRGGVGNDSLIGAVGEDLLEGGIGDDTLDGGIGEDTLLGGEGDDLIFTGAGDDWADGGLGDDTLTGGTGADTLLGGFGDDVFTGLTKEDVVVGGEDPDGGDWDTLDLTGAGALRVIYDPEDPEAGTVEFLDGIGGKVTGTLTFSEIENVVPCFTPGTLIATPRGEVPVECLRVGDKVITRDNGIQEIRWIGSRVVDRQELTAHPHLKPILIRAGALGGDLPERDMLVSPNHRMLVSNDLTTLYFEEREVLAAAKHLVNSRTIRQAETLGTSYLHFMFDHHQVVLANGAWTESFQPGDQSLRGVGNSQRNELFELFPDLATRKGLSGYAAARRTLRRHEAMLLVE